jgi:glucokinase
MELIAGDIGGTKSGLAWVKSEGMDTQEVRFEQVYASADFATADDLVRQFIVDARQPATADTLLLALPGPLRGQHARLTNLEWTLDAADMQASLGVARVRFINDFQAAAAGVASLTAADGVALNPQPVEAGGVRAITAQGPAWAGVHAPAPTDAIRVLPPRAGISTARPTPCRCAAGTLRAQYGHVSWERVVSGSAMNDL